MTVLTTNRITKTKKVAISVPNEIAHIHIRLEGRPPFGLLMDNGQKINFSGSTTVTPPDSRDPREQATDRLYVGIQEHNGEIVLPVPNLAACFIAAGKFKKVRNRQVTTSRTSMLVGGCLRFSETELLLQHNGWEVLFAAPTNASGSKSQKHLPYFTNWAIEFDVELDCSIVPAATFREIVELAGKLIGIGPMRPERKRMYGQFMIGSWGIQPKASK